MRQETRHPDLEQCGLAGEVLSLSRFSSNETVIVLVCPSCRTFVDVTLVLPALEAGGKGKHSRRKRVQGRAHVPTREAGTVLQCTLSLFVWVPGQ